MNPRTQVELTLAALATLLVTAACSSLEVTVTSSSEVTSPDAPVMLTVTAENRGQFRVGWGEGSSSCQLKAVIRVEGSDFAAMPARICTMDFVKWELDAGESLTESWEWRGDYYDNLTVVVPAPGTYEVRGMAGDRTPGLPIEITVEE